MCVYIYNMYSGRHRPILAAHNVRSRRRPSVLLRDRKAVERRQGPSHTVRRTGQ